MTGNLKTANGTMKTIRYFSAALLAAALLAACGGGAGSAGSRTAFDASDASDASRAAAAHRLAIPRPPAALATDSARLAYVAEHYWDAFDFRDTTWIADTAALEQTYANFLGVILSMPPEQTARVQRRLVDSAAVCPAMYDRFVEVSDRYLDDPNSPMRSEEHYIRLLEAQIASPNVDEAYKIAPRGRLETALKNRPGTFAADFNYTTASGRTGRLSKLRGEHTLLLFYTPGCPDCARVERYIADSKILAPLIASHRMAMLAVYVDGDLGAWRAHLSQMPAGWTVGCDPAQVINDRKLYALPAIPNLYLLDKDKRVIFKDAPVERIEAWLAAQKQETGR